MRNTSVFETAISESSAYLDSPAAYESITRDPYWPKWSSPWWHITLLNEMREASRIPKPIAQKMTLLLKTHSAVTTSSLILPIDPALEIDCFCALGNIYQALHATGIDVDQEIPWIKPLFFRYQMEDGGITCDNDVYLAGKCESSIVGTIAPLEAVLYCTTREFTAEELTFLDRGAKCLINRKLMKGSHDEEREDEQDWLKPCFPRFYLYDVLRGLTFITRYSERLNKPIPNLAIEDVVEHLCTHFADGVIKTERHSYAGVSTRVLSDSGEWTRQKIAFLFPLLEQVSALNQASPYLTREWTEAKERLIRLATKGLLT